MEEIRREDNGTKGIKQRKIRASNQDAQIISR
jgi:hypothetical protein